MNPIDLTPINLLSIGVFWLIVWYHWFRRPRLPLPSGIRGKPNEADVLPLVSVIVPARNEAHNIARCVQSLLAQDYPRFEVIVVDDRSEDGTLAIVARLEKKDKRLRLIRGVPLPEDWMGKAHAVHQGYRVAAGEWLLFTDADTEHEPFLLSGVMSLVLESRSDFATVISRQMHPTFGVRLTNLAVFTYLFTMVIDVRRFSNPRSRNSLVNGQYLLFSREAYESIGTHESVRHYSSTDASLGYLAKLDGWIPIMIDGHEGLRTTMYRSFREAFSNWSRSLVNGNWTTLGPIHGTAALLLAAIGMCLFWIYPWIELASSLLALDSTGTLVGGLQVLAGITLLRFLGGQWLSVIRNGLLAPVSVALFLAMTVSGLARSGIRRGTVWKGRVVRTRRKLPPWKPGPPRAAKR